MEDFWTALLQLSLFSQLPLSHKMGVRTRSRLTGKTQKGVRSQEMVLWLVRADERDGLRSDDHKNTLSL